MKKKLLLMSLVGVLVFGLVGCGSSTNADSDKDIKELEERIEELEAENEELREKLAGNSEGGNKEDNKPSLPIVKEQETWADDYIIPFTDDYIFKAVKDITKITERDITYGDIKYINEINIRECLNSSCLRFFTGLEKLKIGENGLIELDKLDVSNLHNLTELTIIQADDLETIDGLENLDKLSYVFLDRCDNFDISVLSKATELKELKIATYNWKEYDLSFLLELNKLEELFISDNKLGQWVDSWTGEVKYCDKVTLDNLQEWVDTHVPEPQRVEGKAPADAEGLEY